jgi:aryl-alcohol dehydrogenase-like predicted oxidoreductase
VPAPQLPARGERLVPGARRHCGRGASCRPENTYADLLCSPEHEASNHAIIDAVGEVAAAHGVSRTSVALAWLHRQPVVTAPLVGAGSIAQIDDAIASLDVVLSDEDVRDLIAPCTPRHDWQGVSDEATMNAVRARIPGMALKATA